MERPDIEILTREVSNSYENSHAKGSSFSSFERFDLPIDFPRRPPQNEFDTLNLINTEWEILYED